MIEWLIQSESPLVYLAWALILAVGALPAGGLAGAGLWKAVDAIFKQLKRRG